MRLGVDARFVALATVAIVTVVTDADTALISPVAVAPGTVRFLCHTRKRTHKHATKPQRTNFINH